MIASGVALNLGRVWDMCVDCDEGLVVGEALGEISFRFEWPEGVFERCPGGVLFKDVLSPFKVTGVVGAKVQVCLVGEGVGGERVEEAGLDEAVFVVAFFGPGVWEEQENAIDAGWRGEGLQEFECICLEEMEIGEGCVVAFAQCACDAA